MDFIEVHTLMKMVKQGKEFIHTAIDKYLDTWCNLIEKFIFLLYCEGYNEIILKQGTRLYSIYKKYWNIVLF